jgi:hypothetical protein
MAYYNSITNDALTKERHQAFQHEADKRRLVRIADAFQPRLKTNILAALRKRIAKVTQLRQPDIKVSYKA